mmetsp:Transcript_32091/g.50433  ORF Transcript_32091/g.50433 Transcript_32091/m.50433 type:complete len:135 (-) Transcript_32091:147-551(-)
MACAGSTDNIIMQRGHCFHNLIYQPLSNTQILQSPNKVAANSIPVFLSNPKFSMHSFHATTRVIVWAPRCKSYEIFLVNFLPTHVCIFEQRSSDRVLQYSFIVKFLHNGINSSRTSEFIVEGFLRGSSVGVENE